MIARGLGFLLVAMIAICAWIASQRVVERKQNILITNADYEQCIPVQTPPLVPPKTDVFHPRANVELS
jgi:hypothetical protein